MAESTLSISLTDLQSEVGGFLGYGVTAVDWSAAQAAEIDRYVHAGYRQFLYPPAIEGLEVGYEWSFLKPTTTIDTVADDAAQDLPDAFGRMLGDFLFAPDSYSPSIVIISEARLQYLFQETDDTGRPRYAAIRHKEGTTLTTGQRQEVAWWPIPDDAYTLTYRYEAYTGKMTSLLPYPLGGMRHAEAITESCLAVAELRADDERGVHWDAFVRALATAIAQDRKNGARYFGFMGQPSDEGVTRHMTAGTSYDVTYKGDTW